MRGSRRHARQPIAGSAGRRPRPAPLRSGTLADRDRQGSTVRDVARRRSPTRTCRRTWHDDDFDDDAAGSRRRCPATGAPTRVRRRATGRCSTGAVRRPTGPGRRTDARWLTLRRRSSTRATCGSTAPTSATPRATSSPTPSRSPTRSPRGREHLLAVEVDLPPPDRSHRQAQHHRRVPALGLPRPRLEPRRHLATGAHRARRARCASPACGCCAARPPPSGRSSRSRATLDTVEARTVHAAHDRSGDVEHRRRASRSPRARTEVEWTRHGRRPALWWPHALGEPTAARRPRRGVGSTPPRAATRPTSAEPAHRAAAGPRMRNWIVSVNGERLFLKGANHGPDAHGARRGDPGRAAPATSRSPWTPASTCSACTPTSPGPSSTTPPTRRGCCCGRTCPLQWGYARGVRKQARPPGPRGGRPARPPPVDRALVRAQRADGHRHRAGDVRRPAEPLRRSRRRPLAAQQLPTWNKTRARPLGEAGLREGRRHPARDRPLGRAPPPAHSSTAPTRHLYFGWYHGDERDFPRLLRAVPRLARFVTEFGAQAVPADADVPRAGALARPRLGAASAAPTRCRSRSSTGTCRPADVRDLRRVAAATQAYQADRRAPSHRDAAAAEVPADRRLRPVLLRRRPPGGDVVGARPRPGAEAGLRRRCARRAAR